MIGKRSQLVPGSRRLAWGVLPLVWWVACATEPAPLDRTQPEAVPKAIFTGEWLYNATVTDTEWDNPYTFIGEQTATYVGGAFKVRWEISQNLLNGYRVPERYRDARGSLVENVIGQRTLLVSFPVKKHYDIRYRYNSTTREDLNVIEENTDRPWQDREYMEVDWSKNLAPSLANPLAKEIAAGAIEAVPAAAYDNVEFFARGPDAEHDVRIDTRTWNPKQDPEVYAINIDLSEAVKSKLERSWQFYEGDYVAAVPVKTRHSFVKVPGPTETDYQPLEYGDDLFRRFGYFRTEYPTYDPERGPMENQKKYLANRWDVRGARTIVYYASPSFQEQLEAGDPQLLDAALRSIASWNEALRAATGRTDDPILFQLNEPLVGEDGQPVLDRQGRRRWKYELGDLRYSFLNFVVKPQSAAPLGYGPSTPDSDTGEIKNGVVNVYGNWIDFVVRRAMDMYDVASGNCTLDQVKDGYFFDPATGTCDGGEFVGEYQGGVAGQRRERRAAKDATPVQLHTLTPALLAAYYPKADIRAPAPQISADEWRAATAKLSEALEWEIRHPTVVDPAGFGVIAGTKYESMLVPGASLQSLLPRATSSTDPGVVALLSPASRLSPAALARMREAAISPDPYRTEPTAFEPAIHAFVEEMQGQPRNEVYLMLRNWIWYTSILHEMGHTLGLRHNFRGSVDQRNFSPEYWDAYLGYWQEIERLRGQYQSRIEQGDAQAYRDYVAAVDTLPSTHNRYGSTSIMDYMGDWTKWQYPVGSYDRAAILLAYGNKVEVKEPGDSDWRLATYQPGDFVQEDPYDESQLAASGRQVRYYMFCSDEKVFDDAFCTMFDTGVTATEIMRNFIRDSQAGYFFRNFKRQSAGFEESRQGYYFNKWIRTYYMRAKPLAELTLATMRHEEMWPSIFDGLVAAAQGPETRDMIPGYRRDGGEDLLRATLLYYYYLLYDVLSRPDYGWHARAWDRFGQAYFQSTEPRYLDATSIAGVIPAGPGWGWNDRWDVQDDTGQYYPHLTRIGVELDKVIALEILSIPAALNEPLAYEKANGVSFWNSLWTNNGSQAWQLVRGLITDGFNHPQQPWCMRCDAACRANPTERPPELVAYPVSLVEGLAAGGLLTGMPVLEFGTRCGPDEHPVQPGMDALFAIQPMFYAIAGASHPWYQNGLEDRLDSQVVGGNHQYTPPPGAVTASFVNSSGTKTYLATQTADGTSIAYDLCAAGARIRDRLAAYDGCLNGIEPPGDLRDRVNRSCAEILACYGAGATPDYCGPEGWDSLYSLEALKYRDLDRIEAMLIMMQDMVDLAGHYQWRTPGYLQE
jgi:hypothetical protein